ncbi:MAG: hypothetical protein KDD32_02515 [Bacteroidetes bacterium]|nr:hypothetical protein [Bacteroidota bacterium]
MKSILLIFLSSVLFSNFICAQVEEIIEEINDAYEYYESAFKKIKNTLYEIDNCYSSTTMIDLQYYAEAAESELSSAKRYVGYAEDEANEAEDKAVDINCDDASAEAADAENYFYAAKRKIAYAIDELSNAYYEDEQDYLLDYVESAEDYIHQAIRNLNYAVDKLNNALEALEGCSQEILREAHIAQAVKNYQATSTMNCDELYTYIKSKGNQKGKVSSYTMNSEWLKTVTAYEYLGDIYVIAEIKRNEYSFSTNSYIFCGIPQSNWNNFKLGGLGVPNSYGERFHNYIFNYKCNC